MKCPKCNKEFNNKILFCTSCGTKLNQDISATQTPDQTENIAAQNFTALNNVPADPSAVADVYKRNPINTDE